MKTVSTLFRSPSFSVFAISIALTLFSAKGLHAQTDTTWMGGTSNWNNGANWSGGSVPSNGGGMTYNVFIDGGDGGTNSAVSLDVSATINQLNIDLGDSLDILDNRVLTIDNNGQVGSGQVNNAGLISISGAGNTTALRISGAVSLSGGGTISMSGLGARIDGSGTLTNVDNTISGTGNLGNNTISIINQGTIQAGTGESLTIDVTNLGTGTTSFDNQNLVVATGGGVVTLTGSGSGEFGGSGTYRAEAGSRIDLVTNAVVRNSTFDTIGDGEIRMASGNNQTWDSVTNSGNVIRENNGTLNIENSLNNSGQISLIGAGNTTQLSFGSGTMLTGGGSIVMSGSNAIIGGSGQTTNVDNTISGSGNLGNNTLSMINQGMVQAGTGESLLIDPDNLGTGNISFDNQNLVVATGGGVVTLTGSGSGEFGGSGTYRAEAGSRIDLVTNAVVRNTTFDTTGDGEIRMVSGSNQTWDTVTSSGTVVRQDNGTLNITSSLNNSGQISLESAGNNTNLSFGGATTLNGGGSIVMSGGNANIGGSGQTTNVDNTISGTGNLGSGTISIINQGTVQAGALESMTIDVTNLGAGTISFDNQNLVLATGGGVVTLTGSGSGEFGGIGTYRAEAGSRIDLVNSAVVRNTNFATTGNGEIRLASVSNQTWDGVNNSGNVVRQDNGTLTLTNSLVNSGQISVNGGGNTTRLIFSGAVNLSGGGDIVLSGNGSIAGSGALTNVDNTISGTGNFGINTLSVINQGVVQSGATEAMTIDPSNLGGGTISFDNQNLVVATGGGVVTLTGSGFGEFGGIGTYRAEAGSRIDLVDSAIARNTNFVTTGNGEIRMASGSNQTWDGVNNSGNVVRQDNGTLTIINTLVNSGQVSLTGGGNTTRLTFTGNVDLSGGGDIGLSGTNATIGGNGGILTNVDNTISGTGIFGINSLFVINQGTVQAGAGESMTIDPGNAGGGNVAFDNQGLVRAVDGGVVTLTGSGFGEFAGAGTFEANDGTLQSDANAIIQNISGGTLNSGTWRSISSGGGSSISIGNLATSPISTIGADAAVELRGVGSSFTVAGTSFDSTVTANDGSLTVGGGRVLNTSAGLSNTGSVVIDGSASSINLLGNYQQNGASAVTRLLNSGTLSVDMAGQIIFDNGFLVGNGDLFGDSSFGAASTISPGLSAGIINVSGDTEFDGILQFELSADLVEGVSQNSAIVNRGLDNTLIGFDQINVFFGMADLDGTMLLDVSPGFNPMVGDFFDLMTADMLTLQPTFSIVGSGGYTYDWSVVTLPDPLSGGSNRDALRAVVLTSAIPEPGSFSLLFACALLGLSRRRRSSQRAL